MASSPGSKTTQIADVLESLKINYQIIAIEKNENRIKRLINNIQRQNLNNIKILNLDVVKFNPEEKFDIIFLDAPCSGNLIDDSNWLKKEI
jgi:16S rRNA C967 or C1407 C5-methylase (RsmB/RsmF family)